MRFTTFLRFLGLTFAFLVIPAFASAQQSITCEANNNNRKYCGSYRPDQVRLQRQISGCTFYSQFPSPTPFYVTYTTLYITHTPYPNHQCRVIAVYTFNFIFLEYTWLGRKLM